MRFSKEDSQKTGGQQMGGATGEPQQQSQQQGSAMPQAGGQAPKPVRFTDWASI